MEENQNQEAPKMSSVEAEHEEFEMNHTDKLVGIFSEPGKTFSKISKFPPKTSDWMIPVLVFIVLTILSQFVLRSNPVIKAELRQKTITMMEKQINEAVAKGQMTQAQADERLNQLEDNIDKTGIFQTIGIVVGVPIGTFIVFFIVSGFFFVVTKWLLKGTAVYKETMIAYGLPFYIASIAAIVMTIAALAMSKYFTGVSVADFLGSDKTTLTGFLLSKLDIFSVWFYVVFGIGLAKMNKSEDSTKYIVTVIACWLVFGLLFHFLARAVPFLGGFAA